jgi:hypothetical protein
MRYLLVVGFVCDVYRREPRARLFFNNQLLDEFNIKHFTQNKNLIDPNKKLKNLLDPYNVELYRKYIIESLPPLFFYEIDIDDRLKKSSIRIDIDNNDSNYVNGFISKSTLLTCSILSLLPLNKKIFRWFSEKMINKMFTDRYAWFRRDHINSFFGGYRGNIHNKTTWIGNNGQLAGQNIKESLVSYNIGGSGGLHCNLIKKYGIMMPELVETKRSYLYKIHSYVVESLYNKYEQHAN